MSAGPASLPCRLSQLIEKLSQRILKISWFSLSLVQSDRLELSKWVLEYLIGDSDLNEVTDNRQNGQFVIRSCMDKNFQQGLHVAWIDGPEEEVL